MNGPHIQQITIITISCDDPEVKKYVVINAVITDSNATDQLFTYFSDWRKLKTAVAWFLKMRRTFLELVQRRMEL